MSASDISCVHCGRSNPVYRIWCEDCHSQLPMPSSKPSADPLSNLHDRRKRLYDEVLNDLDQLVETGEATAETSVAVGRFYRQQLDLIKRREAASRQLQAINQMVAAARQAAFKAQHQQAIELLRKGASEYPIAYPFAQVIHEVEQRIQFEKDQQRQREVDKIVAEAAQLKGLGLLQEAADKLDSAIKLDPSHQGALLTQKELQDLIGAPIETTPFESRAIRVESVVPDDDEESIPLATLVEESDTAETTEAIDLSDQQPTTEPVPPLHAAAVSAMEAAAPAMEPSAEIDGVLATSGAVSGARPQSAMPSVQHPLTARSFAEEEELPSATQRFIDSASQWSSVLKPFLVDNVGWFVGAFLVIAGFVVLIVNFWGNIEQNQILMHSIVYLSLAATTGMFFAMAYFMRLKYPQLESSSNVLLVIVALLIPLVFAAAVLTTLVPASPAATAVLSSMG